MPRRDFIRDLQEASSLGKNSRMVDVKAGDDDGVISCTFSPDSSSEKPVEIQLLVSDLSSYPKEHDYFVYTTTEDVPQAVTEALEEVQSYLSGLSISDMLMQITSTLEKALSPDSGSDLDMLDAPEDSDGEYGWSPHSPIVSVQHVENPDTGMLTGNSDDIILAKLAVDLREAKMAGFRVGYLGNPGNPIISISCRLSKLAISEEAMQAWHVNGNQYLVCLIRYIDRYRSLEEIMQEDSAFGKVHLEFQADLCDSYKPTLQSALTAFNRYDSKAGATYDEADSASLAGQPNSRKMIRSFISKPLNALLNERFVKILQYRHTFGFPWSGAEVFLNDVQGKSLNHAHPSDDKYTKEETLASSSTTLPDLVTSDHLIEKYGDGASFPLIAMQFVLRHFVRCTEFCLVCHCKTEDAFEALKPYVCSKSLCLYQYMALGFGPSLEWEVISQPYVVDLLVSFTYASAKQSRLDDFPTGLGLLVPPVVSFSPIIPHVGYQRGSAISSSSANAHAVTKFDYSKLELLFPSDCGNCPVRTGDWIVISDCEPNRQFHCRVQDISFFPTVHLSSPVSRQVTPTPVPGSNNNQPNIQAEYSDVTIYIYNHNFDDISAVDKQSTIAMLLDTLPSVDEMRKFLLNNSEKAEPMLTDWRVRISKSALDVLRWIVASNRSCIIQDGQTADSAYNDSDRVSGMENYMQFRFAQGAPDKEQRFVQAVAAVTERLNLKYPTIFAWHGSRLSSWHGILREGLHFRETVHGRAFGNGVYMSPDFTTSSSYTRGTPIAWPQSQLKIQSAISLNEVVNAPNEFVSKSPHLVVAQLDWIQPRYLFVSCQSLDLCNKDRVEQGSSSACHLQDPEYTAKGPSGNPIRIPVTAVSQGRRIGGKITESEQANTLNSNSASSAAKGSANMQESPAKRRLQIFGDRSSFFRRVSAGISNIEKSLPGSSTKALGPKARRSTTDGYISEDTDDEDNLILLKNEQDTSQEQSNNKGKASVHDTPTIMATTNSSAPKTDFVPGTLIAAELPLLEEPKTSTLWATKALLRDLNTTLKTQETQPLHELGWYVDPSITSTVYQWIVELHSFDPSLPLATDLQNAGLKSVVLELRFPSDYPISPPFVRVIRPRFLSFFAGGGGHVTAGGALCMELLTNSGWSAVSSIESVLLQVRMAISSTEPHPARLAGGQTVSKGTVRDYGVGEAMDAYIRACRMHGWEVPKDFGKMTMGGGSGATGRI
ncbi:ubiquitin conjugating enzyme [Blastomyces dermatitidis ER-3]|uniref:Ubiquitin conjugating enzyme n=2 Tax=Ajellomyces dermatitidis TaxID=5039 RepID=F2TCF8_AJEDA|nr:ubiquitin conjugating enzyme [Blastomyces dermatitidis ER-3]EEQ89881.1 ubiquitin conjugating enzyme [Blastomyces dermatitidis ER-3]EGE80921.1 ubiquitin conjugating enzyme [Blastomyces dermatitidis ATCC 18188]